MLLPLTTETRGLLNKHRLGLMPNGASLINFARGAIVDADDLIELLNSRHLDHAVLDVFTQEPSTRIPRYGGIRISQSFRISQRQQMQ